MAQVWWHRPRALRGYAHTGPHTEVGQALPWVRQCQRPSWVPGLRMERGLAHLRGAAPRDPGSVVPHGHLSAARQGLSWGRSRGQRRGPTASQSPALPCAPRPEGPGSSEHTHATYKYTLARTHAHAWVSMLTHTRTCSYRHTFACTFACMCT